ncbi:MAG: hypothetical protein V4596_01600 [Bdellovibrionota bacterium]
MKTLSNRKLLAVPGLFVALCALTSFNPFSQANHLSYLNNSSQQEESITLAQNLPSSGARNSAQRGVSPSTRVDATLAGKMPKAAPTTQTETAEVKAEREKKEREEADKKAKIEADKSRGSQSSVKVGEGEGCIGKDCAVDISSQKNSQVKALSDITEKIRSKKPLTDEENELLVEKLMASQNSDVASDEDSEDVEEKFCSEGDYDDRLKCFKKEKKFLFQKKSKATAEARGLFKEDVADLIAEIALDDSLEVKEQTKLLNRIAKFVKDDRDLSADVRIAIQSMQTKRSEESFSRGLEAQVQNIESLDTRIADLQNMQRMYGFNAQAQLELDQRSIERKNLVYGMEKQIAGYRESIKRSLPAPKAGESTLITQLRDQRTASYQTLIEPLAPAITDKRLITLDYTLSGSPTIAGQNGVYSPTNGTGTNTQFNAGQNGNLQQYDSTNPAGTFAGVSTSILSGMNPQQQVDYRKQNGIMYNPSANNFAMANQYQQQNTGLPTMNGQQQRAGPTPYTGY